ncbi:hypothetical protein ABVK25_003468 [Lepraria finkii]|uniref:Heterokaryon incompatibility domain-containing protein n=1 Tax=Lepraria finkii TaxID=1340010 RepID=A0ABR4BFK5_9LECA
MDALLLCLVCRRRGPTASKCLNAPPGRELNWFISEARESLRFDNISESSHSLCRRCKKLDLPAWLREDPPIQVDRDLKKLPGDRRVFRQLGRVDTIVLKYNCPLCRCLFGLIPFPSKLNQKVILVLSWSMYRLEASISMDTSERRTTSKYISAILDPTETGLEVEDLSSTRGDGLCAVMHGPDGFSKPLSAVEIDPDCIDYMSIRRWLRDCDILHSSTCQPRISTDLHKICLIDARSRRLITYSSRTSEYLALTYVWGKGDQHVLGAGTPGTLLGELPRTIEDAIAFTEDLGKRYLWVDLVCIDQSNEAKKSEQISIMSAIYQGAYATIVAFSGASAEASLPRVRSNGTPYRQLKCSIDGISLLGFGPTLSQLVWELPWGCRAWTFQEAVLSPKTIYISKYHVYMECNALTYCETLDDSRSPIHQAPHTTEYFKGENYLQQVNTGVLRSPLTANVNLENNALRLYSLYVTLYSRRELTKQSDAQHAFSGILQALQTASYKEGFTWALPHQDINWALLWEPMSGAQRSERFPTWSWLSWRGDVVPGQPTVDGLQEPHRYTFDLTTWKSSTSGDSGQKIFAKSYDDMEAEDQESFIDDPLAETLPAGDGGRITQLQKPDFEARDLALCIESFVLTFDPSCWTARGISISNDYHFFQMRVDSVDISIRVIATSELCDRSGRQGKKTFLLLSRNVRGDGDEQQMWVYSYLLLLGPIDDGIFERRCALRLKIPQDGLRVLKSLNLTRRQILLV